MQRIFKFFLVLATSAVASNAFGHGFTLKLENNTILPTGATVFSHVLTGANDVAHGGIRANDSFLGTSPDLQIEFNGGLWFSDGGAATPSSVSMYAVSTINSNDATISGAGASPPSLDVDGTDSHEILWALFGANPAPGVYGISYRATGSGSGGPFNSSPLLTVLFHTLDFDTNPDLAAAQAAVASAALVPEPASLGLLALGVSVVACVRRRSRRRQR